MTHIAHIDNQILYIGIVIIFALLLFLLLQLKKETFKYHKINSLFTPTERKFLLILERSVKGRYRVYAKTRIADIVKPRNNLSKKEWSQQFWRTSSKHFDYVLCSNDKIEPLLAIELNDSSHEKRDRKKRDIQVSKICKSAHLPILWIPVAKTYNIEALWKQIDDRIVSMN